MSKPTRFILTIVVVGILMGTVLILGTRNAVRATETEIQTQIDNLQTTMEQRDAEYQAQLDAANQTVEQLETALRERDAAHQAEVTSAQDTIAEQQATLDQTEAELVQANGNAGWLQATLQQREQEWTAQLEAANQTILQLEGK